MTLGDKFDASGGRPAGFDYMRLILALSVVCWHTLVVTYGLDFQNKMFMVPKWRLVVGGILPAFFTLSGFLVAGSLQRCKTLAGFLYLRIIRIFPALVVEIILSALILGPVMTAFAMPKYFSDLHFYSYFLNCLGDIHYKLPGLFLKNPLPSKVNGQLWTVPYELECYIALAVLGIIGLTHRPKLFLLMVASLILYGVLNYLRGQDRISEAFAGHQLVLCFLIGVLFYIFREKIPYDRRLGLAAIAVSMICFWIPGGFSLAPLPIAYTTVFLGLTQPHRLALIESGDYSYGIFLYGFPIQQAVVATRLVPLNGWTDLLTALPFVLLFAILSWHFWEKPMLHLRRFRPAIDRIFQFSAPGAVVARVASLAQPANPD